MIDNWRIKEIKMEGLFDRHDLCWQLDPAVNILGGANGSGKSTILHALAFLLQSLNSDLEDNRAVHCEALFSSLSVTFLSGGILGVRRYLKSTRESLPVPEKQGFGIGKERIHEQISFKVDFKTPEPSHVMEIPTHVLYINSSDQAVSTVAQLVEKSGMRERPAITVLDLLLERALNERNQLFTNRLSVAMQHDKDEDVRHFRELFGRFEEAVKELMPSYILQDTSSLLFSPVDDDNTRISYFRLSTGEKQLLYMLLSVCNTLGESTILLLDEADTGMHIDWKKRLLRELLKINPNMQIIAATHSPSLIDGWYGNVREVSQLYTSFK